MFERTILIVDDNKRVEELYIPLYLKAINELKIYDEKWRKYDFKFVYKASMSSAMEYLSDNMNVIDVIVVDYDFGTENTFSNGTEFVNNVRETINRNCRIIFYTMQGIGQIAREDLVTLINADIFKFLDKSGETDIMVQTILEAATLKNQVVDSLEHFFMKYRTLLNTYNYRLDGEEMSFEEVINHIRMDDTKGRIFIEKLLQKAVLLNVNIEV